MKIITLKNWSDFYRIVNRKKYRKWIFRGHSDDKWTLESSLHRAFDIVSSIYKSGRRSSKSLDIHDYETIIIDRFKRNAHLYLNHLPKDGDPLSWLSLMQHHGAPTRLLDFTFSPFIALFFALEFGDGDASIYGINHQAIKKDDDYFFGESRPEVYSRLLENKDYLDEPCLIAFEPTFSNHRLLAQQGLFVAINGLLATHEEILNEYEIKDKNAIKMIIPASLRYQGLKKLNQMNINAAMMYPGLDGFCKSMRQQPVTGLRWQKRIGEES